MFLRGRVALALSLVGLATGCPEDDPVDPPTPDPAFPADYASSYTEVRDCRQSVDHDLNVVRILADPVALAPYRDRDQPFPADAVVLKEEYDFGDTSCSGDIKQWTVMVRLDEGSAPDTLDWKWQQVDAARHVVGEDTPRCYGCHTGCTPTTDGYEHTCAVP